VSEAIGVLRARVRLERPSRTEDDLGGAEISWVDEGAVWAELTADGVAAGAAHDTMVSTASLTARMRPRADVRMGWRVVWGVRVFRVLGVKNDGGARIELSCEEEVL